MTVLLSSGKMMRRFSILLVLIAACSADSGQTPEYSTSATERVDINKTVLEVEKILDKYPELPRIDRSEILSILQNITEEDSVRLTDELTGVLEEEKHKMQLNSTQLVTEETKNRGVEIQSRQKNGKNSTRTDGSRSDSVMVVLPFKPEEQQESLEELYTRSPIVRMEKQKQLPSTTPVITTPSDKSVHPSTSLPYSIVEKEDSKFNPPLRVIGFRYHTTSAPEKGSTDFSNSPRTYTNYQSPEQVTMAFTAQEFKPSHGWNHQGYQAEASSSSTEVPIKSVWDFETKNQTSATSFHVPDSMANFSLEDVMLENSEHDEEVRYAPITRRPERVTTKPSTEKVYITSSEKMLKERFTTSQPATTTTTTTTSTTTPKTPIISKTTTIKPRKKQKVKKVTTTTVAPNKQDLANVLDNLPPDLKDMLGNLGVNSAMSFTTPERSLPIPVRAPNANIDPSSYQFFKPIPIKRQKTITDEMQTFLSSYGLLDNNREQKAMEETTTEKYDDKFLHGTPQINADLLTDSMKETLENLGLYQTSMTSKKSNKNKHIFNPKKHSATQSEEELKKLNTLLNTIKKLANLNDTDPVTPEFQSEILRQVKELDNITISYKTSEAINSEIHKIMERNKGKFRIPIVMKESSAENTLQSGLDPAFFEDVELKNEVKRQENGTNESSSTSISTTEGSTSTTEPANSAGLEDSFGGGDTAPVGSDPSESLPPKRPNGLYFLLDWNTFFEVGTDDDARRVNIRFQPKVGDGRNFLPVTIP